MANFRVNCDQAIYEALNVRAMHEAVSAGVSVFNSVAPAETPPPFVVFQMQSKTDDHSFNGRFAQGVYVVKAVSQSPWPKEAADIDTQIDTLLEDPTLSITGYTFLSCRRESDFTLVEHVDGKFYQHVGGLYRVWADQT